MAIDDGLQSLQFHMCFSYALQLLCRYELQSAVPFHDDAASK